MWSSPFDLSPLLDSARPSALRSRPLGVDFVAGVGDLGRGMTSSIYWSGVFSAALYEAVRHCPVDTDIGIAQASQRATVGGDLTSSLASRPRFCAMAASANSSGAPPGPRSPTRASVRKH